MSITKRASRNIFWLFVSEASSKGLIFLGTIYLARVLGKGGFGLFSLSLAVGIYFWAVVDMGIVGYGTREIARNKQKSGELYSLLNTLRFILAMGLFVIFSGALYLVDMTLEKKLILMAGGFYVVTNSLSPDWVLRGLEKMQYIALGSIATSFFFLVCIYLAVWDSSNTLWASIFYPCSFLFGNLILMAILYFNLKIPFYFKISLSGWRLHIRESFYFAINGALHTITVYIPFFLMGFWSTAEDIGIFSAPHKITALVIRGGGLIVSGLYPILSSLYETNIDDFRRSHAGFQKIIIGVILPICIITTIQSNDITTFLFGISYTESARILTVLIWLSFLIIIRYSFGNALLSANQHRFNMFATGAGTAVVLISSMVLIPAYGGYGAAWALISGEIVAVSSIIVLFRKKVGHLDSFKSDLAKILLAGTLMALIMRAMHFSVIPTAIVGIFIYSVLSLITGIINRHDLLGIFIKCFKKISLTLKDRST